MTTYSSYVYNREYCSICNQRACESDIASFIHVYKCTESENSNLLCHNIGCCHGCNCNLKTYCQPDCLCDCHKDIIYVTRVGYDDDDDDADNSKKMLYDGDLNYKLVFNVAKDRKKIL